MYGTWKNRLDVARSAALSNGFASWARSREQQASVVVLPPVLAFHTVAQTLTEAGISVFAQNAVWDAENAFTGETSVASFEADGCTGVMIGHSERRTFLGETDQQVCLKAKSVLEHGLEALVCVGETYEERVADRTEAVLERQLSSLLRGIEPCGVDGLSIAYEPSWAITTNEEKLPADPELAHKDHEWIRSYLRRQLGALGDSISLVYGAGVNPSNAASFAALDNVDGVLVGSASQDLEAFDAVVAAVESTIK